MQADIYANTRGMKTSPCWFYASGSNVVGCNHQLCCLCTQLFALLTSEFVQYYYYLTTTLPFE